MLAYWGGLTAEEIADRERIPLGTAKSRIRLGLAKLRSEMAALAAGRSGLTDCDGPHSPRPQRSGYVGVLKEQMFDHAEPPPPEAPVDGGPIVRISPVGANHC